MPRIEDVISRLEQLVYQKDKAAEDSQQRIARQMAGLALTAEPVTLAELHVLQQIGADPTLNVISISRNMGMTRGAISKICSRLERKGLVVRLKLPANHKEVFFRLTVTGQQVWQLHEENHQQAMEQYKQLLNGYSQEELQVIERFLGDLVDRK